MRRRKHRLGENEDLSVSPGKQIYADTVACINQDPSSTGCDQTVADNIISYYQNGPRTAVDDILVMQSCGNFITAFQYPAMQDGDLALEREQLANVFAVLAASGPSVAASAADVYIANILENEFDDFVRGSMVQAAINAVPRDQIPLNLYNVAAQLYQVGLGDPSNGSTAFAQQTYIQLQPYFQSISPNSSAMPAINTQSIAMQFVTGAAAGAAQSLPPLPLKPPTVSTQTALTGLGIGIALVGTVVFLASTAAV